MPERVHVDEVANRTSRVFHSRTKLHNYNLRSIGYRHPMTNVHTRPDGVRRAKQSRPPVLRIVGCVGLQLSSISEFWETVFAACRQRFHTLAVTGMGSCRAVLSIRAVIVGVAI